MDLYLFSNLFAESMPVVLLFWGIAYVLMTKFGRVKVRTTIALVHFAATTAILALVAWPIRGKAFDAGIQLLVPLVLSIISCAILYFQERTYQKSKRPAVVASAENCVAEQQEQPAPIPAPVTAMQPVQQINRTVVAGVVTLAGCFYLFAVMSANQAYNQAFAEYHQAVAVYEKEHAELVEKAAKAENSTYPPNFRASNYFQDFVYIPRPDELPQSLIDTKAALKKAELAKRYPLASLFNKADVK